MSPKVFVGILMSTLMLYSFPLVQSKAVSLEVQSSGLTRTIRYSNKKKTVEGFILATDDGVVTVTLPAFHRTKIIPNVRTYFVAFDWSIQKVYWVDRTGSIKRANLDGTDAEIFLNAGHIFGLAVDSNTGNVYYARHASREIKVCSRDGEKCSVLATELKGVSRLDVDSSKGLIFWANDTSIIRANLDGTNATTVLFGGFLRGVDESSGRLYWEQERDNGLASCDFQGKDTKILLNNTDYLSGVAIYDDVIYFSNVMDEKVRCVSKNGTNVAIATKTTASVNGIITYGKLHNEP